MRLGFYTPNYPQVTGEGGIGTYTQTLGRALVRSGHEVHVLTPGRGPTVSDAGVFVHRVRTDHLPGVDRLIPGAGACWRVARAMHRLARLHRLDLVEFPNWEGYGALYLRSPRRPVVVRLHTSARESQIIDKTPPTRWHRWDVRRERWVTRWADAVVTHSHAHARLMSEETGLAEGRIRIIPHGVDVHPEFVRPPRPPGPPTVVFLGRMEHRKGTVELLQAVPRVLTAVPDARFVLIGADRPHCPGGRTHAAYLEQDFTPEVRRQVTLAGRLPQPEVDRYLQTADVFVAPSRYESFGLIFIEAMRWGTPVVGTTAGGIPEIVEHGRSGLLVPPESPSDLAAALVGLLTDPEYARALGVAGRQRVERDFSIERMARQAEALYEEVIRTRRKGHRVVSTLIGGAP